MPDPVFERLPFLDAEPWRVAVINPTGRYARNQVAGLIAAGSPLVGGGALGRGGEAMDGLPLYDRVADLPLRAQPGRGADRCWHAACRRRGAWACRRRHGRTAAV